MAIPTAQAITAMKFCEPPTSEMKPGDELRALGARTTTDNTAPNPEKTPTVPTPPTNL